MNSPPSSLATLLLNSAQSGSQTTTTDDDGVALMTYLREAGQLPYSEAPPDNDSHGHATHGHGHAHAHSHAHPGASAGGLPRVDGDGPGGAAPVYRATQAKRSQQDAAHAHAHATAGADALPINAPAPASPIDTSVPIPDTLASLPPPPHALYLAPLSGLPAAGESFPVSLTDRGEMGGKRRKALHDRAGWKEMEDDSQHRDKRARGENDEQAPTAYPDFGAVDVGMDHVAAAAAPVDPTLPSSVEAAAAAVVAPVSAEVTGMDAVIAVATAAAAVNGDGSPHDDDKPTRGRGGKDKSKESRAEQNRKAQQIFRRRREEKIKQLEADSAALAQVRQRLTVAEARIEQLALDLEAKTIEAHALRTAVTTIATHTPVSVVTPHDNLTISPADFEGRDTKAVGEDEGGRALIALDSLCRASRELAKVNRARRLEDK